MKRITMSLAAVVMLALFSAPAFAQEDKTKEKEKEKVKHKQSEQIIITRKNDSKEKIVVEIVGDKVTVNGKPIEELKEGGDVQVHRNKYTFPAEGFTWNGNNRAFQSLDRFNGFNDNFGGTNNFFEYTENHAMLGVVTEGVDEGAEINEITKGSGAEKAGLKAGDIITKIDDKKINNPDQLTTAIRSHKPGDKVVVTILRDKKEQKLNAELGKAKNYTVKMPDMKVFEQAAPGTPNPYNTVPRVAYGFANGPKLGLSVQDTDDGKGVKVLEVDDESNAAKAGVKEGDIITSFNDQEVNDADAVAKLVRAAKDKPTIKLQITRGGKSQTIEVKMPRKLKTADL